MPSPRLVLVRPRDPNNIGAAARAAANFGVSDLRVVAPHPPVWREAKSAVGATALLRRARECATLQEALEGCGEVYGTTSMKGRRAVARVWDLPDWRPRTPFAVVFGPEKTGLTAEDLTHCTALIRVPTTSEVPSMNLGQAVAVVAYEWRRKEGGVPAAGPAPAPSEVRERLAAVALEAASAAGHRDGLDADERLRRLRAALARWGVTTEEAGMLTAMVSRVRSALR